MPTLRQPSSPPGRATGAALLLARQRQERILEQVRSFGGARVSDLVDVLGVSDMTVRRDIAALAARGLVTRVHGGATAVTGHSTDEPGFAAKSGLQTAEKAAIAASAAHRVDPGSSVALSAGTTTVQVARALRAVRNLTIVTNSVPVADVLRDHRRSDTTVLLTGGVRTPSDALVGPVAVATLQSLHVDWLFLGVHGMDCRAGLTTPNLLEGETDRAFVESASRTVVVADHTKWGVVGLSTIAQLEEIDVLVSDDGLSSDACRELSTRVGRLEIAPRAGSVPGQVETAQTWR